MNVTTIFFILKKYQVEIMVTGELSFRGHVYPELFF